VKLYLSKGWIWTGTQADARAAADGTDDWEPVEVPVAKPDLLKFLNDRSAPPEDDELPLVIPDEGDDLPVEIKRKSVPDSAPEALYEKIMASEGSEFAMAMEAALSRLNELGAGGWDAFAKVTNMRKSGRGGVERSLGMLMLAALGNVQ
jgi:hypothetical protein